MATFTQMGFSPTDIDFNVHLDHVSTGTEMSKQYQRRDRLDEKTTKEIESTARFIRELEPGEALEVIGVDLRKRGSMYTLDVLLKV